jgi:hypothetical protein
MKKFATFCFILVFAAIVLSWVWVTFVAPRFGSTVGQSIDLYQKNARTPIFSGFLTMGSFLLALKTNILGRLKETYDTPEYRRIYRASLEKSNSTSASRYYASLERLSKALGWNIFFCLLTALFQMTLGFYFSAVAFAICVGTAAGCLILLMYLTYFLMKTHQEWFDKIEQEAQQKLKELDKGNQQIP